MDAKMSIADRLASAQKSFRIRRMRRFGSVFSFSGRPRILDVGGTEEIWEPLAGSATGKIVLLNMPRAGATMISGLGMSHVHGDGCRLPFADQSFNIVFSNSVIEHVGGAEA